MYDNRREITKQFILNEVGEVSIFMKYLNLSEIKEEELICNPLRADKNPTASFKWVNDRIQFRDWSETFSRDCFNVAQLVTRKDTFYDTLIQIAIDFNLVTGRQFEGFKPVNIDESLKEIRKSDKKREISIIPKAWHSVDLAYWKQFGIDKQTLIKWKVFPIGAAFVGELQIYTWFKHDIGFAYYFGNGDFKLYFPLRKKEDSGKTRFIHNNAAIMQGWDMLPKEGDHCIITKSYKEVIAFSLVGVIAVAPMSETMIITQVQYEELKRRFKTLFILNDNDWAGRKATIKVIRTYPDIIPLLFPKGEPKDYTDNIKVYGINDMAEFVEKWRKQLLNAA